MQRLIRLSPLILFLIVSFGLGLGLANDPRRMPSTLIDKPIPSFTLPPLEEGGAGFSSDDLKGKIALLNVFASWCGSCRVEHPLLMALARRGEVPIYGLNWKDSHGDGARWLAANRSPYVRVGDDRSGRLGIDLGVSGVPETFLIDRTGRIRLRYAGPVTDEVWRTSFAPLLADLESRR